MAKRKRKNANKANYTAGPLSENSGQRSAFPELVPQSTSRDPEWRYDDEEGTHERAESRENVEHEGSYNEDDLVGQTFSFDQLDFGEEDEEYEEEEEEGFADGRPGAVIGEVEDDEWEVEPQTEALAYLEKVRNEAESLPALRYTPQEVPQTNIPTGIAKVNGFHEVNGTDPKKPSKPIESTETDPWKTQFLQYYTTLRKTISETPFPCLTQPELDSLLNINPYNRPTTSSDEDRLWRLKTLSPPSLTLLAMLDQKRTLHLLTHLRKKMSPKVTEQQCMWTVFLLARLGDLGVLYGEEVDLLRRIGRKCLSVRRELQEGQGKEVVLGTVDMVVCIIREYYAQRDLEEMV
jgi:hypothetical protein